MRRRRPYRDHQRQSFLCFRLTLKTEQRLRSQIFIFQESLSKQPGHLRGKRERKCLEQLDSKLELKWVDLRLFAVVAVVTHHLCKLFLRKFPIFVLVISSEHCLNLKCVFFNRIVEIVFLFNITKLTN